MFTRLHSFFTRCRTLFQRRQLDARLDQELQLHLDLLAEENARQGMTAAEARRQAAIALGGASGISEEFRDVRGFGLLEDLVRDARYGLRSLRRSPGFTAVTVLVLALGIGANTAIFSLANAVLLKPLPFGDAGRLVMVWEDAAQIGFPQNTPAPGNFTDWKQNNRVFEDMAALNNRSFNLTGDAQPIRVMGYGATWNFLPLLGVKPLLGRTFGPDEDRPGAANVAVLNYALWKSHYGGDREVLGRAILLNGEKYTVIGVMPREFTFLDSYSQIWVPMAFTPEEAATRGSHYLHVIARLKPGVTLEQARADMGTIMERIRRDYHTDMGIAIVPLRDQLAGRTKLAVFVLLAGVGCVLLIACANLANLLLSRAVGRRKEWAVRMALGAGRRRMIRQVLTESLLLAAAGGGLGVVLAFYGRAFLQQMVPDGMSGSAVQLDATVLLFATLVSLLTGVAFGLIPALHASGLNLNDTLRQGGTRSGDGSGSSRVRSGFVIAETALALVLLVTAGLLLQTFARLRGLDPGFRPGNVLTMRTVLPESYMDLAKRVAFYDAVLRDVRAAPGVISAAYSTAVPLTWKGGTNWVQPEGRDNREGNDVIVRQVTPDYFATMGIPLKRGRFLDEHDRTGSPLVAVVSETMARSFWPGQDATGKRFRVDPDAPWVTVVGVAGDVREMGLDAPDKPEMYFSYAQETVAAEPNGQLPPGAATFWKRPRALVIRFAGDQASVVAAARRAVMSADKDQPVSNIATLDDILNEEVQDRKLQVTLLGSFAALALLLAALGIYGVLSYIAGQRTQEIGVRMALGARPADILRLVAGQGIVPALAGIGVGLAAAAAVTRLLSSLLFGVRPLDPPTFIAVALLLACVALAACSAPAFRAMRIDPMTALRAE